MEERVISFTLETRIFFGIFPTKLEIGTPQFSSEEKRYCIFRATLFGTKGNRQNCISGLSTNLSRVVSSNRVEKPNETRFLTNCIKTICYMCSKPQTVQITIKISRFKYPVCQLEQYIKLHEK